MSSPRAKGCGPRGRDVSSEHHEILHTDKSDASLEVPVGEIRRRMSACEIVTREGSGPLPSHWRCMLSSDQQSAKTYRFYLLMSTGAGLSSCWDGC